MKNKKLFLLGIVLLAGGTLSHVARAEMGDTSTTPQVLVESTSDDRTVTEETPSSSQNEESSITEETSSTQVSSQSSTSSDEDTATESSSSARSETVESNSSQSQPSTTEQEKPKEQTVKVKKTYITVYRLYNTRNKEHLYTTDKNEMTVLLKIYNSDWKYEGPAWMSPNSTGSKVYRVYNPRSGEHLYTKDSYEAKILSSKFGWRNEGKKFYSDTKGLSVYRLFNSAAGIGAHFVTRDAYEKNSLASRGWKYEGVAWKSSNTSLINDYTPPQTPRPPKPHAKRPTYYSQLDARWANVRLNDSLVKVSGCVPTSLAMVFRGSYRMNVDPGTVAKKADVISKHSFGLSGKDLINTAKAYGHSVEQINNKSRAITLLKAGYPLVFYINVGIGHAVVTYGYNNGIVEVFDPYNRQFYPSGRASLSSIWNKPSADTMDWDAGRPVFAIK